MGSGHFFFSSYHAMITVLFILQVIIQLLFSLLSFLLFFIQAYMFKYDSTHGGLKGTVRVVDESTLEINGKQVQVISKRYYSGEFSLE